MAGELREKHPKIDVLVNNAGAIHMVRKITSEGFETTLATSLMLARAIPSTHIAISESGIFAHSDLERLSGSGISTFLVGESLMRQPDVEAATRSLLGPQRHLRAAE